MRTGIALGAGVLFLALALTMRAPATLADARLNALSGGRLRMVDARGTVWNGSGTLWLPPGFATARIDWHVDAWPLLWGELRGSFRGEAVPEPRASFALASNGFALRDVVLAVPAGALLRTIAEPLAASGGTLGLRTDALIWRGNTVDGRVAIRWDGASLPGPKPEARLALGDVRLDAIGQGNALGGTLANAGGDVDISGSARLAGEGARIEMLIRPRAGIDTERGRAIAAALAIVAQSDGAGGYRLVWSAPLR